MAFRHAFRAAGTRWRYYSGQRNGTKCHTYIPDDPNLPTIRSDKRLKDKAFIDALDEAITREIAELLKRSDPCRKLS